MKKTTLLSLIAAIAIFAAVPSFAGTIRISSTIGPVDAGIIPLLADTYKAKTGVDFKIEKAGTGATLEKAKTGNFDMVVVHARALEDQFIKDGYGQNRKDFMYNDFVILGPQNDPAGIKGMKTAAEAFKVLAEKKAPFISRGDMSGTHVAEMNIWKAAGITCTPKIVPAPRSSRKEPMSARATVNPSPIPIPSNADRTGPFFMAYASARPRMIQFTTISGM